VLSDKVLIAFKNWHLDWYR